MFVVLYRQEERTTVSRLPFFWKKKEDKENLSKLLNGLFLIKVLP